MIKKLRRQFILVTMLSTFAVLAVIIGALNIANYVSMNASADALLDILVENDGQFPDFFMGRRVEFGEQERRTPPGRDGEEQPPELPGNGDEQMPELPGDGNEQPPALPGDEKNQFFGERRQDFSNETPYETRFFSVKYSATAEEQYSLYLGRIASVSEDDAKEYAQNVIRSFRKIGKMRGYYGNYRYRIKPDENGGRLVVFLDLSKERNNFYKVLRYSLILSGVGLLAVFVLVWFFSKKVFKPVEESDRKQKRFITDASHELKTPLTIISANVEVMEMESEESEWSRSIKKQVKRMTSLVEQMVTLSRLDESSELEMADFSLSDAVRETAEAYLPVTERNNQEYIIDVKEGIRYHGDEKKIRQMVGLLIENATKYTAVPEGCEKGTIKVSLQGKGKKNKITVWNTTEAMEAGNKEQLFERFYRPDESRNSKKGGSGIGLSIVKSIADAHKGKVSAASPDGKSMQFEVIL